ncbi:MAG TPA: hypothetical protein ENN80_04830, partial [Candidatus Hydrogenedentes bacterium]|nr:hypothetical protein [Candidatus Hydrogenedentota bacterium]
MENAATDRVRTARIVLLLAVLGLGAWLRCIELDASYWEDELISRARLDRGPAWTLEECTTSTFYLFPQVVGPMLGYSEGALRLPSVVFGVLAILTLYGFVAELRGVTAGMLAALLLAVSPFHVRLSQQLRMYGAASLAAVLLLWLLYRAARKGGLLNWVLCLLVTLWGVLLHGMFLPLAATSYAAALLWLLIARRHERPRIAALVLCGALAAGGYLGALSVSGYDPRSAVSDTGDDATAGQEFGTETYELTPGAYLEIFRAEYFALDTRIARFVLLVCGLCGLGLLAMRNRLAAALVVFPTVLVPIPLFILPMRMPFTGRHTFYVLPLAVVCIATGITAIAEAVRKHGDRRRLNDDSHPGRAALSVLIRSVPLDVLVLAFFLAAVLPASARALAERIERRPERDWKGIAEFMGRTMQPQDVVYYVGDDAAVRKLHIPLRTSLLLGLPDSTWYLESLTLESGLLPLEDFRRLAYAHPHATLWFVLAPVPGLVFPEFLRAAGATAHPFRTTCTDYLEPDRLPPMLWVLGAPTENLVPDGGFEALGTGKPSLIDTEAPGLVVCGAEEAYDGHYCLGLKLPGPDIDASAWLPVRRDGCRLRNAGFEVWDDGRPAGWSVSEPGARIYETATPDSGRAIGFRSGKRAVVLQQPVAIGCPVGLESDLGGAGRTVRARARVKAAAGERLGLTLVYDLPGHTERVSAWHPGGRAWDVLTLKADLPGGARLQAVEVRCEPFAQGEAIVDDVAVWADDRPILDGARRYTLSLMLKYERVLSGGYMHVRFKTAGDGDAQSLKLHAFYGTKDWHFLAFPLIPGVHLPESGAIPVRIVIGLSPDRRGRGHVWMDNVQLEPGDRPTP